MSLLTKAGISKLSELDIDAAPAKAKDIAELILTTQGDILYRSTEAARLAGDYGVGYNALHVKNSGQLSVEWVDIQEWIVYLSAAVNRMIALPTLAIAVPVVNLLSAVADASGGAHTADEPLTIPLPTVSEAAVKTTVNAVGGAVAHDNDGVDTDETTEANSAAANDMTLLQADGAVPDWYALGFASKFDAVCFLIGTVGADITLDTFEYSKGGAAWGTLTVLHNQLNDYETAGKVWFTFEREGDWAVDTIAGIANLYWVKFKASATGGGYSQPLGTQAWILVY